MIFEVLTSDAIAGQLDFVAASAPPNELIVNGVGAGVVFENSFGLEWFEPGDNLLITGFFCRIPYGFGYGSLRIQGTFEFRDAGGVGIVIPEFADTGNLVIPDPCGGLEFPGDGLFVRVPTGAGRVRLFCSGWSARVSLVNVPSSLVGVTVQTLLHWTLKHTRPMQAVA